MESSQHVLAEDAGDLGPMFGPSWVACQALQYGLVLDKTPPNLKEVASGECTHATAKSSDLCVAVALFFGSVMLQLKCFCCS